MTVREIMLICGPSYLETYKERIPYRHQKTIGDIISCRTPAAGTVLCRCNDCGDSYEIPCSCGNRHCPTCQADKAQQWLKTRLETMLPVHHFMITFTVPADFRKLFRSHQRVLYSALFKASSATMMKLACEQTYFPGDSPGFFGVLHTWGRRMQYHPHIHYIVPGGAFDSDDHSWHTANSAFFLPVRVMAKLVKHKMFSIIKREGLLPLVPASAWEKEWNVNSQAVGSGERSIRYLAAYVFRTAISDKRIIEVTNGTVCFCYTDTKTGKEKTIRISAHEFIRRFLEHVLPSGFMKIRYYGFMHPSSRIPLKLAVLLLEAFCVPPAPGIKRTKLLSSHSPIPCCKGCGGSVSYVRFIPPRLRCSRIRIRGGTP